MEDKILDVKHTTPTVLLEVNSNFHNNNAINANHAHKDNHLLTDLANSQDQHVIVIKNITLLLIDVTIAQQIHSQIMELVVDKISDAKFTTQHVMLQVNNNLDNNNALDVKHAQLDNNSLETFAKFQDQHAIASKNIMLKPTDVIDADQEHSQITEDSMVDKILDVLHSLTIVPPTVKSLVHKIHAMLVNHVLD
jgi:hypothetical protein